MIRASRERRARSADTRAEGAREHARRTQPEPLRIELLGGFRVAVGSRLIAATEWRRRKAAHLLKLLALAPGHRLHREQALELLWPDLEPEAAANNLHYTLHAARRVLEPDLAPSASSAYLGLQHDVVALCPAAPLWLDTEAFEAACVAAPCTQDPAAYEAALALYRGDLLPEDRYEDWTIGRREELRRLYLSLLLELARLHEERGALSAAVRALERAVASEPGQEEAHAGLMRLYAQTGQRPQALRQYEQLRAVLERELGVAPEAATEQLYQAILAGQVPGEVATGRRWVPGAAASPTPVARKTCPP